MLTHFRYLDLLHNKGISSFMVTNAQFPGLCLFATIDNHLFIFLFIRRTLRDIMLMCLKYRPNRTIEACNSTVHFCRRCYTWYLLVWMLPNNQYWPLFSEQLKIVDRPLFPDYWERFLACIDELSKKGQRTVFRLTLIKGWNMEEVWPLPIPFSFFFYRSITYYSRWRTTPSWSREEDLTLWRSREWPTVEERDPKFWWRTCPGTTRWWSSPMRSTSL